MSDHTRFDARVLPPLNAGYNLARWLTRGVNDAEDAVQAESVRALKYGGSLAGAVHPRGCATCCSARGSCVRRTEVWS